GAGWRNTKDCESGENAKTDHAPNYRCHANIIGIAGETGSAEGLDLGREFLQHRLVNANSGVEIFQGEILIRRMRATVGKCESQQQCFRPQDVTKIRQDWYAPAFANQHRIALERFL